MSAQVADRFRDGRIFLAGDAAHRFPPTGGLGLNTGVADAHGLVWKLTALESGWAGPSILDTYQVERQPIAGTNCEQSTTNAFKLLSLVEALGLTVNPTTDGLLATLADQTQHPAIAAAVTDQTTHFDMVGLQLGYCYLEGAVAHEGSPPSPPSDDPRVFEPEAAVGCRLPHAWLDDGSSTLDLVQFGCLTLLSFGAHERWESEVACIDTPIRHIRLGVDAKTEGVWEVSARLNDGALLVRPDQHIGWRSETPPVAGRLDIAVRSILGDDEPESPATGDG